jgi:hypothetical protein
MGSDAAFALRLPADPSEEAESPRRDKADGEQHDHAHCRLLMRAHPHLCLACCLRAHQGHLSSPLSFAQTRTGGQGLIGGGSQANLSSMITLLLHLLRLLPVLFGGHRQLALENLALRQQLAVYKRMMSIRIPKPVRCRQPFPLTACHRPRSCPGGRRQASGQGDDPRRCSEGRRSVENRALVAMKSGAARARRKTGGRRRREVRIRRGNAGTRGVFGDAPRRGGGRDGCADGEAIPNPSRARKTRRRPPRCAPPRSAAGRRSAGTEKTSRAKTRRSSAAHIELSLGKPNDPGDGSALGPVPSLRPAAGPSSTASGRRGMTADRPAARGPSTPGKRSV